MLTNNYKCKHTVMHLKIPVVSWNCGWQNYDYTELGLHKIMTVWNNDWRSHVCAVL